MSINNIAVERAALATGSQLRFYKTMQRIGWLLLALKSTIVTCGYLRDVRAKKIYCPHQDSAKFLNCPDLPCKRALIEEFERLAKAKGFTTGITKTKNPDCRFLTIAIGSLDSSSRFFDKAYVPISSDRKYKRGAKLEVKVANEDNLFTRLHVEGRKRGERLRSTLVMSREEA